MLLLCLNNPAGTADADTMRVLLHIPRESLKTELARSSDHVMLFPRFCITRNSREIRLGLLVGNARGDKEAFWFFDQRGRIIGRTNWISSERETLDVWQCRLFGRRVYYGAIEGPCFLVRQDTLLKAESPWALLIHKNNLGYGEGPLYRVPLFQSNGEEILSLDDSTWTITRLDLRNQGISSWHIGRPKETVWYWQDPIIGMFGEKLVLWQSGRILSVNIATNERKTINLNSSRFRLRFGNIASEAEFHGISYFSMGDCFYVLMLTDRGIFVFAAP